MSYFNPPPLSKVVWMWLREWQRENGLSDEDLAAALKLNINTLKSYDISAHTLTIEKIDNLVATVGIEPLSYVILKFYECVECQTVLSINSIHWENQYPQESNWLYN